MNYPNISVNKISKELELISEGLWKWKMSFNRDNNKQAQEVVFDQKIVMKVLN